MDNKASFERDTTGHVLTVLKQDGLYRHLRLKNPASSAYWFDIVTWPGYLSITGDMGAFTFTRIEDMFEFFRNCSDVNLYYWAGKLVSTACSGRHAAGAAYVMSADLVEIELRRQVHEFIRSGDCQKEDRRELVAAMHDMIRDAGGNADVLMHAAQQFAPLSTTGPRGFEFCIYDFPDCTEPDYHFEWCCRAIRLAIQKFDEQTTEAAA